MKVTVLACDCCYKEQRKVEPAVTTLSLSVCAKHQKKWSLVTSNTVKSKSSRSSNRSAEDSKAALLALIRKNPGCSAKVYAKNMQRSRALASMYIQKLVKEGLVESRGKSKNLGWYPVKRKGATKK